MNAIIIILKVKEIILHVLKVVLIYNVGLLYLITFI